MAPERWAQSIRPAIGGGADVKQHTTRMDEDIRKASDFPCSDFPPYPLTEIEDSGPDDEPPAEVSKTVVRRVEGKPWDIIWFDGITNKTASGVAVKSEHEEKCEVMGVPERLEALVADLVVRSCVHDEHD